MSNSSLAAMLMILILAAGLGVFLKNAEPFQTHSEGPIRGTGGEVETYGNETFGFSFDYPAAYVLREREVGTPERARASVSLISEADTSELEAGTRGEGPTAITFDIFQNNLDQLSVEQWVESTNGSNYKLPPEDKYIPVYIAGKHAVLYRWDGLYQGESVVFSHNGNIIMASVSFLEPYDPIRSDFTRILASLEFSSPVPLAREEALHFVGRSFPELAEFFNADSSDSLPVRAVNGERSDGRWNFSFEIRGSGVPYVLEASCYEVTDSFEAAKTGEYRHDVADNEAGSEFSPSACAPTS